MESLSVQGLRVAESTVYKAERETQAPQQHFTRREQA
jgi:hypothetical protein